jgi:hypothetical protein
MSAGYQTALSREAATAQPIWNRRQVRAAAIYNNY